MSKRLLPIFSLVCAALILTASSATAQDLRPEDTFFIKPRIGLSNYLGDNEKSPFNFNGDMFDNGFPYSLALELGYQFSVPFSISLAYQFADYPIITQFPPPPILDDVEDDPSTRSSIQLFGRYTFANARSKIAPYLNFGLAYSFGDVLQQDRRTEESGSAFGPLLGAGLDIALNDRSSFFLELNSGLHFGDEELDANEDNGFGSIDALTGWGLGFKINFKRAFTPVMVTSVTCPTQTLTVGQSGNFSATTNADATQPVEARWDFGDGNTATGNSVTHSYSQSGTYTVTFTATNEGSTDSGTCTVRVIAPPEIVTITANKTTVSTCDDDPSITFSANVRGDAPLTYRWDFGDGTPTSNQASPTHTYANVGTYTVTLTLSNAGGSDSRTMTVTVNDEGCFPCDVAQMGSVYFDRNDSTLDEDDRRILRDNLEILQNCDFNARIDGFASLDERNPDRLSEDRARAVMQFYIDNGIAASRLTAVGNGAVGGGKGKGEASGFRRADTIPIR